MEMMNVERWREYYLRAGYRRNKKSRARIINSVRSLLAIRKVDLK